MTESETVPPVDLVAKVDAIAARLEALASLVQRLDRMVDRVELHPMLRKFFQ